MRMMMTRMMRMNDDDVHDVDGEDDDENDDDDVHDVDGDGEDDDDDEG